MLVSVQGLGEDLVACEDHDDGEVLIDQCEDTMLQFTRHDSLAMEIRDLFDLECTYNNVRISL